MKYQLGNCVINADHIKQVQYYEPGKLEGDDQAHYGIALTGETDGWSMWLNGKEADLFWDVYSRDAIEVTK